ncbi:unnamed protein product [Arctia plantaginis]|uniref:Uncharacterized protein n=1 Tax=Arctia plantaginis TaxID=874455 RepID=A0A8S1A775_ARCPL|nr:unnamed protein product [Arctia plantaginis]
MARVGCRSTLSATTADGALTSANVNVTVEITPRAVATLSTKAHINNTGLSDPAMTLSRPYPQCLLTHPRPTLCAPLPGLHVS